MPRFIEVKPISHDALEKMGFSWHQDIDGEYILRDKFLLLTHKEVDAYIEATNELYKMYEKGAEYVIENELYDALDIPSALVDEIKRSFKEERRNHLYGRFDLSGGIDNKPIKLIEFNADTPTVLLESSVIQYMMLKGDANLQAEQFNTIYEAISKQFVEISKSKKASFSRFLFSCVKDIKEEDVTTKLLQRMASDASLVTAFSFLEDTEVENGFDFWFKLYPWEDMQEFKAAKETSMLNPAFTLLYQSKGMLAILYELFPRSPYLLQTKLRPLDVKYVKKRMFGREGANIDIVEDGKVLNSTDGIYEEYKAIYQEYTEFVKDEALQHYQAGVFYSNGACGIGFRRGAEILDDMSQFVAHVVI